MAGLHEVEERGRVVEVDARHQAAATECGQSAPLASSRGPLPPAEAFPESGLDQGGHGRPGVERRPLGFPVEIVVEGKRRAHPEKHMRQTDFCQPRGLFLGTRRGDGGVESEGLRRPPAMLRPGDAVESVAFTGSAPSARETRAGLSAPRSPSAAPWRPPGGRPSAWGSRRTCSRRVPLKRPRAGRPRPPGR